MPPHLITGIAPLIPGFLGRPSLRVRHACLELLLELARKPGQRAGLGLARVSTVKRLISCLDGRDFIIRLTSARLVGRLIRDVSATRSLVFPETTDSGSTGDSPHIRLKTLPLVCALILFLPMAEFPSNAKAEVDAEFDPGCRSLKGCIPPLLGMVRLVHRGSSHVDAMLEQEVALLVLRDIASANNLCREAITTHGGVPILLAAVKGCTARARRALAGLLAELSITPGQRQVLKRAGGLLVLLQFQRSQVIEERIQAELALRNFGPDALTIHLSLARASMEVVQARFLCCEGSTVGPTLLRPIHDRQLREASKGLAECAMHQVSALKILEEGGLPMLLNMLRVRDFPVQFSTVRVLLHIIRHCGQHFSDTMGLKDRESVMLHLASLVRPVQERGARLLQVRWRAVVRLRRTSACPNGMFTTSAGPRSPPGQTNAPHHQDHSHSHRKEPNRQPNHHWLPSMGRSFSGGSLGAGAGAATGGTGARNDCCVALVLNGDITGLACLAVQCLERLSSQSVTATSIMLAHDVMASLTAQLHTYDTKRYVPVDEEGGECQREADNRVGERSSTGAALFHASSQVMESEKAATRLQRQCIATLSSLALNTSGSSLSPSERGASERVLLFLATYHWAGTVRAEANLALRRLQSRLSLPHPTRWSESDCFTWLVCINLSSLRYPMRSFLSRGEGKLAVRNGVQAASPQSAGINGYHRGQEGVGGQGDNGEGADEEKGQRPYWRQLSATLSQSPTHGRGNKFFAQEGRTSFKDQDDHAERGKGAVDEAIWMGKASAAGMKMLQVRRDDLLSPPFNTTPEEAMAFLRHLRALRILATATSFQLDIGDHALSNDVTEDAGTGIGTDGQDGIRERGWHRGGHGGGIDGKGLSIWQEKKHAIKEINRILAQPSAAEAGLVLTNFSDHTIIGSWDTIEASDRFGALRTLRLVRGSVDFGFKKIKSTSLFDSAEHHRPSRSAKAREAGSESGDPDFKWVEGEGAHQHQTAFDSGKLWRPIGGETGQHREGRVLPGLKRIGVLEDESGKYYVEVS
ncbi:unnamed protein product [Discosporangium mesarthrocarpum]